jgi:hypothetical protein
MSIRTINIIPSIGYSRNVCYVGAVATFVTLSIVFGRLSCPIPLHDFHVQFHYIKGANNSLVDALSRLPFSERQNLQDSPAIATGLITASNDNPGDSSHNQTFNSNAFHDDNLLDCFVHLLSNRDNLRKTCYVSNCSWQTGDAQRSINDCAGESWGRSAAALCKQQTNKNINMIVSHQQMVWVYLDDPNQPWKIYLPMQFCTCHPMVPSVDWSHLTSQIDRQYVINILSCTTTQGCRGSTYALCSCQHLMSIDTLSRYSFGFERTSMTSFSTTRNRRGSNEALCCSSAIQYVPWRHDVLRVNYIEWAFPSMLQCNIQCRATTLQEANYLQTSSCRN